MQTNIQHLPAPKQHELNAIIKRIQEQAPVEMIILFGSYARGDWAEEMHEDGEHFVYQSDFDLLIVVETRSTSQQNRLEYELEEAIDQLQIVNTPISIIVHDIEFINRRLAKSQYFFLDILKEGILLHDSGKFQLETPKQLSAKDRYHLAKENFGYWFDNAKKFFKGFSFYLSEKDYSIAAFHLHQTTEKLYTTILLVFTHYKPNTHNLETLRKLVNSLDSRFLPVFPLNTDIEKQNFKLLCKAYVDGRYKKSYVITAEELNWLCERITHLMQLTDTLCQEKIAFFRQENQ